jgi:hypothetical protein
MNGASYPPLCRALTVLRRQAPRSADSFPFSHDWRRGSSAPGDKPECWVEKVCGLTGVVVQTLGRYAPFFK